MYGGGMEQDGRMFIVERIWSHSALKPLERAVLTAIVCRFSTVEHCSWPSFERLQKDTGLSLRTVKSVVAELRRRGVLVVSRGEGHRANVYRLGSLDGVSWREFAGEMAEAFRQLAEPSWEIPPPPERDDDGVPF